MPDMRYYARLQYNANGGSGAPSAVTASSESPNQSIWFAVDDVRPTRTYYDFLGWAKSSGASSASYFAGGSIAVNTSTVEGAYNTVTLYAVWKRQTAYVKYNANGGTGAPDTQYHNAGTAVTLSATKPTRTGYVFKGWASSATATTAQYQPSTSYNLYTSTTIYAVWQVAVSVLTASNGTMGTAMTIGITRYVNTYTDTITYQFGTASGTIATKTSNASVSWTPPTSLASEIPNASSGTVTFTCTTYNGNTVVGTSTKTVSLAVPQSLAPTASVSHADTVATCISWGVYVQSRSKIAFTITASGQQSATIASYRTTVNGATYTSNSFTTDVLIANGTNTYTTVVTDSRGLQTTVTGTFSVEAYAVPSLTLTLCDRDDSDDEQINVEFDFTVASVSNNNDANYAIDYKLKSSSTWTSGTVTSLGGYSGTITDAVTGRDGGDEWDIRVRVIDSFQTSSIVSEVGVSGNILLNSRHQGGLGLLMKSQADNQLDVGKQSVFHESVKEMYGSIVGNHAVSGNYAKVLTFGSSVTVGKNLLNPHLYSGISYNQAVNSTVTLADNATQFTDNGDGTFSLTTSATWRYYAIVVPIDSNNNYHVKLSFDSTGTAGTTRGYLNSAYTVLSTYNSTDASQTINENLTIPSGASYWFIVLTNRGTASTTLTVTEPQLEIGTSATTYEAYRDASDLNINTPLTLEYIRSNDSAPTRLTINFNRDYSLNGFTSNNSIDAYLHNSATAVWNLYIGKASASDSVEILDMHNPWSNSDMTVTWGSTSISTLPTGYVEASPTNTRIYENSNSVSPSSGSWKTGSTITLTKGVWIISAYGQFNYDATGIRGIVLSASQDDSTAIRGMSSDKRVATTNSTSTTCHFVDIYEVSSPTTYYLNAYQNCGSALTTYCRIYAIKIV